MAQYNFQRTRRGSDASEDAHAMDFAPPAPIMNPSANWIAPGYPPFGSFGGSTAAHPYLGLEFAPSVAAGSGGISATQYEAHGRDPSNHENTCAAQACHISFPTASKLAKHASESGHKAFLCTCGNGYTRLSTLTRHLDEVANPRQHECPCCECPAFNRLDHVENHLRSHHKMSKKTAIKTLLGPKPAASRRGAGRRRAAGAVAAVNAVGGPIASFSSAAFPGQPSAGPPLVSPSDAFPTNNYGVFADPAAGNPAALAGFADFGMAGSVAVPAAGTAPASAGSMLGWSDDMAWMDFSNMDF